MNKRGDSTPTGIRTQDLVLIRHDTRYTLAALTAELWGRGHDIDGVEEADAAGTGGGQAGRRSGLHEGDDVTDGQVTFRRAARGLVAGFRRCGCRSVTHATRLAACGAVPEMSGATERGTCVRAYLTEHSGENDRHGRCLG